jgi:Domain of unknown function (DUF3291)
VSGRHLAQINIGRLRHELDHPEMADFVAGLKSTDGTSNGTFRVHGFPPSRE